MPLSERDRAKVEEIRNLKISIRAELNGEMQRASVISAVETLAGSIRELLSIIDRLAGEPEVVRCCQCMHSASIPARYSKQVDTGEMMSCGLCRGTEDATTHLSIVPFDGYCDEGERGKEPDDESHKTPDL